MSDRHTVSYHFEAQSLSGTEVAIEHLRLVETLDEPYRLELRLRIEDPDTELGELLADDCVVEIARGDSIRRVCGLVRHIEEGEHTDTTQTADLIVVPALWMLGLRRNTRIFQEMTAPAIVEQVIREALDPYGRSFQFDLAQEYATREYCVQYQETDLAFVHRLLEEEGIHYTFDHEGAIEQLILRDKNKSFAELPSGALVPYHPDNLVVQGVEPVQRFRKHHHETTTSVALRDWDWTRSGDMTVEAEARGEGALGRDRESYEHGEGRRLELWDYDAGARAYQQSNADRQAIVRQQAHVRDAVVGEGVGRVIGMAPGFTFELTGHPTPGFDDRYLITYVEHVSAPISDAMAGGGEAERYYNRFRCIPLATEHRPRRRTAKPRIDSIQTAVVTGPGGEEIHTDEHGRIKVQFHWDREGQRDEHSSCWVRVQQPWAGPKWGFWYLPRIGMEVVVHFVDGDPDRPLVSGCVYNATNLLPYAMPDEKTKSTIKSNSSIGGDGFNEFRFEDKAGSEEIYTHAEKDYVEVVENNHTTLVKHDQTNTVHVDQTQTVHNNQTETVHRDQLLTVDGNRTVHVQGNYDETVDGTETRHVVQDVSETFSANETRTVSGNLTESIGGNETRNIGASQTETISGSHTLTVGGNMTHEITGSLTLSVTGGITQSTPAAYDIKAVGGLTITAAAGIELKAAGGISLAAPGGVVMVDSKWDWLGGMKTEAGAFNPSIKLAKLEFAGVAMGVTGLKLEQAICKLETYANEFLVRQSGLLTYAARIANGALKVSSGPSLEA